MRRSIGLLAMAVVLSLGGAAKADLYTFDFQDYGGTSTGQDLGSNSLDFYALHSAVRLIAPYSVHATGYDIPNSAPPMLGYPDAKDVNRDLAAKSNGVGNDETGLGLWSTAQNEIGLKNVVKLDFTSILKKLGGGSLTLTLGSLQLNEGFQIYGDGNLTAYLDNGKGTPTRQTVVFSAATVAANHDIFYVTADNMTVNTKTTNNVLLDAAVINTNPIPEPSTLAIAGLGALGFGANLWRRRRGR